MHTFWEQGTEGKGIDRTGSWRLRLGAESEAGRFFVLGQNVKRVSTNGGAEGDTAL